jgi:class 3 adenylate cyclase
VLLEGDAGVGKSRLVRELARTAKEQGADICIGRCREHLALPYLAFIDGLLPRLERFATADPELSDYAHLISRLLGRAPRDHSPGDADAHGPSVEQEQTWLFLAIARSVVRLAQHRPLVVAIDDLHWADRPSVDLLTHVVLQIADVALGEAVPLLLVATVRPEVDPMLATDLARLRREDICHRLELGGLGEAESGELLEAIGHRRPSRRLVGAVHEATGGNPLLLENVVHQLAQPGALTEQGGELVPTVALVVPDQLNNAVMDRIDRITPSCRAVLVAASFLGDEFVAADLEAMGYEHAVDELEEAVRAGLLTVEPDGTRSFSHPIYARVVRSLPSADERHRLHLAVADQLDSLPPEVRERHVLEIAQHLVGAGPLAGSQRVLDANRIAAEVAWSLFAWAEAAQAYEAAAEAGIALGHPEGVIADYEYRAGRARYRELETGPARVLLDRAAQRFRTAEDQRGLALALAELARADLHHAAGFGSVVEITELEQVLESLQDVDPALCGRLMAQISDMYWIRGDVAAGDAFARRALELGRAGGDPHTCTDAQVALAIMAWLRLDLRDAAQHLAAAHGDAEISGDPWLSGRVLPRTALTHVWLGDLDSAETHASRAVKLTTEVGDRSECSLALAALVSIAAARGDVAAADQAAGEAWSSARIARYEWGASFFLPTVAGARVYVGADGAAEAALDQWARAGWSDLSIYDEAQWLTRQWVRAHAGHGAEVRAAIEHRPGTVDARWQLGIGATARFATLVELAQITGVAIAVPRVERSLTAAAEAGQVLTEGPLLLIPRVRGVLVAMDGRLDEAVVLLDEAIAHAIRLHLGPELARARLDLARVLRERGAPGDAGRASALAAEASRAFEALGMLRFAGQARRLTTVGFSSEQRDGDTVLLFTDVAGSTALTELWGDHAYRQRATALDRAVRDAVNEAGGRTVDGITLGDGLLAMFTSADRAIDCATVTHRRAAEVGLQLHVGLHAGTVREHGGAIFGGAVNYGARVCAQAPAGETLVSGAVRALSRRTDTDFEDRGLHELKGITEPQRLHAVVTDP